MKRSVTTEKKADHVVYNERLSNSLSRTSRLFFEYAMCNHFPLFCTFTFDAAKVGDRHDFESIQKKLCRWFSNFRNRVDSSFRYMVIPERHDDGAWHFHGFCTVPVGLCTPLKIPKLVGGKLYQVPNTPRYMAWPAFAEKFGYFSCTYVRNYEKSVSYCRQYITKAFKDVNFKHKHVLLKSQGLAKPECVYSSYGRECLPSPDFENEFCSIAWRNEDDTATKYRHWTYITDEEWEHMPMVDTLPCWHQVTMQDCMKDV